MPPLPIISGREAVAAFIVLGWVAVRQRGSHIIMTKNGATASLSIPDHRELDRETLRALIRTAGVDVEEFVGALR